MAPAPETAPSASAAASPLDLDAIRDLAYDALRDVAPEGTVGGLLAVTGEGEVREVIFASSLPGYQAWRWTVEVAVLPDLVPSVLEVALLPGGEALVAPPWVPWADRLAEYQRLHPDDVHDLPEDSDDVDDVDDVDDDTDDDDLDEDLEIADPDEFEVTEPDDDASADEDDREDEDGQADEDGVPDSGVPEPDDASDDAPRA